MWASIQRRLDGLFAKQIAEAERRHEAVLQKMESDFRVRRDERQRALQQSQDQLASDQQHAVDDAQRFLASHEEHMRRLEADSMAQMEQAKQQLADQHALLQKQTDAALTLTQQTIETYETDVKTAFTRSRQQMANEQADCDAMAQRVQDRKLALAQESDALREQLRVLEAKSSPSGVWVEALRQGFSMAWDLQREFMAQSYQRGYQTGVDDTHEKMNAIHTQRMQDLIRQNGHGMTELRLRVIRSELNVKYLVAERTRNQSQTPILKAQLEMLDELLQENIHAT